MDKVYKRLKGLSFLFLIGLGTPLYCHERWIPHDLKGPINSDIYWEFGPDFFSIIVRPLFIFGLLFGIFKMRIKIFHKVQSLTKSFKYKSLIELVGQFTFDMPILDPKWDKYRHYFHRFAISSPALVLMYAAANQSLIMPNFKLSQATVLFQYAQILLGCMILAELALPVVGCIMVGLYIFCSFYYGFIETLDMLPVLAVAYVYLTMPFSTTGRTLFLRLKQINIMRFIIGFSFFILGVLKIYNPSLVIGVGDQHPQIYKDPALILFSIGTDKSNFREWWAFGFGMAEIMMGSILMVGIFKRVICLAMGGLFLKFMVIDFGWPEIPHLFLISAVLLVASSSMNDSRQVLGRRKGEKNFGKKVLRKVRKKKVAKKVS